MLQRKIIIFLFCLFSMCIVQSQQLNTDSLEKIINAPASPVQKIDALQALANYQIKHLQKDSIGLANLEASFTEAEKHKYAEGEVQYYLTLGNYYRSKSNWQQSIEAYFNLIKSAGDVANDSIRNRSYMMAYNNLGGIHNFNGDYNGSLSYRIKAMEIAEKYMPKEKNSHAIIYLNIASDYRQLNITQQALSYLKKTETFFDQLPDWLKLEYYYEYLNNYKLTDSIQKTEQILSRMKEGIEQYSLSQFQQKDYTLIFSKLKGEFLEDYKKNYDSALFFFNKQLSLAQELNIKNEQAEALESIGNIYQLKNDNKNALNYFTQAYEVAKENNLKKRLKEITAHLSSLYYKTGNTRQAYLFEQESAKLASSIYDTEKTKELNFLDAKYQNEKKEKEITELTLSNAEKKLALVNRNRLLTIGSIVAFALLITLGLLYRNSRQKRLLAEKDKKIKDEQIKFLAHQQQVVSLQSMINGQETERTRIAKDLHDGLGGLFSTVKMYLSTLKHEQKELEQSELFAKSYEMVNTASKEVRRIAHNMMPEVLIKLGLIQAVQDLCNNVNTGKLLHVHFQSYGTHSRLSNATEIMLFRIIQELLNNIIKHSEATNAIIQFNQTESELTITIEDNGKGFNTQDDQQIHAGLETVKSRVDYLNGELSIDSQKEIGTTVVMNFTLKNV